MMVIRFIMIVFLSLTALSFFTFQGIEGVKAMVDLMKSSK